MTTRDETVVSSDVFMACMRCGESVIVDPRDSADIRALHEPSCRREWEWELTRGSVQRSRGGVG